MAGIMWRIRNALEFFSSSVRKVGFHIAFTKVCLMEVVPKFPITSIYLPWWNESHNSLRPDLKRDLQV